LDELLAASRRSPGLPSWWKVGIHDRPFLEGLAKHGIHRQDLIVDDDDLPFADIANHYATLQQERKEQRAAAAAVAPVESGDMEVDSAPVKEESKDTQLIEKAEEANQGVPSKQDDVKDMEGVVTDDSTLTTLDHPRMSPQPENGGAIKLEEFKAESVDDAGAMAVDVNGPDDSHDQVDGIAEDIKTDSQADLEPTIKAEDEVKAEPDVKAEKSEEGADIKDAVTEGAESKSEEGVLSSTANATAPATTTPAPKAPAPAEPEEFVWLKEAVVLRRMDHLIDIVIHPKPVSKKKRRHHNGNAYSDKTHR
jgi:hypothetical protein